jgi:hypothetical protein
MKSRKITRRTKTRKNKRSRIRRRKGGQGTYIQTFKNAMTNAGLTFKPIPTFNSCPYDILTPTQQQELSAFLDEFGKDQYPNNGDKQNQLKTYYYRNCDKLLAAINRWQTPGQKEIIIKEYGLDKPGRFGKRKLYRYLSSLKSVEEAVAYNQREMRGW